MSRTESATDSPPASPAAFRWPPVLAIALATFTVVTAEMMPVGLLTPIADALAVDAGVAGMSLTITGALAAVIAPLTPVIAGRVDRRTVLVTFLALLTVANVISAITPSFAVFAVARVLIGIAMGIVWASAGGLGHRLADPAHIARAMTVVFSGVSIGMVLGLPVGTLIANLAGWRAAFWALAVLSAVAALTAATAMPRLPVTVRARLSGVLEPWRDRGVRVGFAITALVVVGHFMAYTYIRPVLEDGGDVTPTGMVIALAAFGLAGVVGNILIGVLAGRNPRLALLVALAPIAIGIACMPAAAQDVRLAILALVGWGAAYGGIAVATQAWIRDANPAIVERSSAMWSGVFNGAIAIGALIGGVIIDRSDGTVVMWTAAAAVALGWITTAAARTNR